LSLCSSSISCYCSSGARTSCHTLLLFERSENSCVSSSINGWKFSALRASNNKNDDRGTLYCSSGSENYPLVPVSAADSLPRPTGRGSRRSAPRTIRMWLWHSLLFERSENLHIILLLFERSENFLSYPVTVRAEARTTR
jgi:hypothetical protein